MTRRLLSIVPTLVGVTLLVFAFLHAVPGDPVEIMLGESASARDVAGLRAALGARPAAPRAARAVRVAPGARRPGRVDRVPRAGRDA